MLTIPIQLKEIVGKGIGIVAIAKIEKGDVVWKRDWHFAKTFSRSEVEKMGSVQQEFIKKYTYYMDDSEVLYFDFDDSRFMNHSANPNTEYDDAKGWATRDIEVGEEITCDYNTLGGVDFTDVEGVRGADI